MSLKEKTLFSLLISNVTKSVQKIWKIWLSQRKKVKVPTTAALRGSHPSGSLACVLLRPLQASLYICSVLSHPATLWARRPPVSRLWGQMANQDDSSIMELRFCGEQLGKQQMHTRARQLPRELSNFKEIYRVACTPVG